MLATLFLEVAMKKKRQEETFVGSPNLDNTWYVLLLVPLSFKRRHFLSSCRFVFSFLEAVVGFRSTFFRVSREGSWASGERCRRLWGAAGTIKVVLQNHEILPPRRHDSKRFKVCVLSDKSQSDRWSHLAISCHRPLWDVSLCPGIARPQLETDPGWWGVKKMVKKWGCSPTWFRNVYGFFMRIMNSPTN